jgi:hypothetical protein
MDQEELHLMVFYRIPDSIQNDVHHLLIYVLLHIQVQSVDDHSNLERITFDTYDKQINELLVCNLIFLGGNKLFIVIFFAVHLKYNIDVISCDQEFLSVVLGYSLLNSTSIDNNLFVVS